MRLSFGRVAAQRQHILDTRLRKALEDILSSSLVEPTQVRCAIASRPVSRLMRETMSIVFSRVDPPAPYVPKRNPVPAGPDPRSSVSSCAAASSDLRRKEFERKYGLFPGEQVAMRIRLFTVYVTRLKHRRNLRPDRSGPRPVCSRMSTQSAFRPELSEHPCDT